jgi:hypothetical protein
MGYTVIRDTREQEGHGWIWDESRNCDGTIREKLDQGDYSIQGLESLVIIERKGGIAEFASNVTQNRFEEELVRLDTVKYPWVLLEFNMSNLLAYPKGSGIPKKKWKQLRFNGFYILKRMLELEMQFRSRVIFCGSDGKIVASSIFKRVTEEYERGL